jgi:acetoin:2,6-dichlorophenolindophenol oxidoreductase subunit alpha
MTQQSGTAPQAFNPAPRESNPAPQVLVDIYRRMSLIKQNDERFLSTIKAGKIVAPYYSPRGQEAIPSAVSVNLGNEDYICTIYRGFHDMLAKGIPVKLLWAEVAGRATGTCKGKGGPMHITHPETGVMVTTGIVGSSMPIANGLALASQIRGETRVTIAYFGDGASNIGAFHEALNMAAIWKLPVVFVCQNNGYGEHTRYEVATAAEHVADRAAAYRMPGVTVDGNDPLAVYAAAKTAIDRARAGQGPTLLEATTFRFNGHVFGDADAYMQKGEKASAVARDPVPKYRAWLVEQHIAGEGTLAKIEAQIGADIDAAVEFALGSSSPDLAELSLDVFA